jgi:Putative transmembrane protein (PGPGW)
VTKAADRLAEVPGKIEQRRTQHRQRSRPYRVAWVAAAVIIVAAGVALVVLPGPAFVVIPIGLAMLSLEFGWASRALGSGIERGAGAAEAVQRASPAKKFGIAAVALAVAAAIAALVVALL